MLVHVWMLPAYGHHACLHRQFGRLPGVLARAYSAVEGGHLEDHPKQATLRQVLTSMSTLQAVSPQGSP